MQTRYPFLWMGLFACEAPDRPLPTGQDPRVARVGTARCLRSGCRDRAGHRRQGSQEEECNIVSVLSRVDDVAGLHDVIFVHQLYHIIDLYSCRTTCVWWLVIRRQCDGDGATSLSRGATIIFKGFNGSLPRASGWLSRD